MNKKILIIEDDKEMCMELTEALVDFGCSVQTACDGMTGKKFIEQNDNDIIILDLKLPKLDGYEILKFIQKKMITARIIVITARMKIEHEDSFGQDNKKTKKEDDLLKMSSAVFIKPFRLNDLLATIKAL
jgi:DNA-binding response OmpR family regulator